jgi:hypothetical protein
MIILVFGKVFFQLEVFPKYPPKCAITCARLTPFVSPKVPLNDSLSSVFEAGASPDDEYHWPPTCSTIVKTCQTTELNTGPFGVFEYWGFHRSSFMKINLRYVLSCLSNWMYVSGIQVLTE